MATRELVVRLRTQGAAKLQGDMQSGTRSVRALSAAAVTARNALASMGVVVGVGAAAMGLKRAATGVKDYALEVDRLHKATGLSRREIQEMAYVLQQEHGDLSALGPAYRAYANATRYATQKTKEGTEADNEYTRALQAMGLSIVDTEGKAKPFLQFFGELGDALNRATNEEEFFGNASLFMGRSVQAIAPAMRLGSKGTRGLADELHRLGAVMPDQEIIDLKAATDELTRVQKLWFGVLADNLPTITGFIEKLAEMLEKLEALYRFLGRTAPDVKEVQEVPPTPEGTPSWVRRRRGNWLFGMPEPAPPVRGGMREPEWMRDYEGPRDSLTPQVVYNNIIGRNYTSGGMRSVGNNFAPTVAASRGG